MIRIIFYLGLLTLLCSCNNESKLATFPLKGSIEAVSTENHLGASSENTVKIVLRDVQSGKSVDIFSGRGGARANVSLLPGNVIVIEYCGATHIDAKTYLFSIADNTNFTDIRVVAATWPMALQGKKFCM